eukprot:TRINITY_DN19844_c0_g1_i1.p1 TRINITY_DN19844_c0_g1~~TRINITY_DN19844_c0_g1_i1.p1  ORF type:complete len:165 (-),score=12.48 TRINITY_DN19844_c0_g1_i1:44-538(-)
MSGATLSILAGLSAASASVLLKLAFDSDAVPRIFSSLPPQFQLGYFELSSRVVFFILGLLANALMMNFFAKSMNLSTTLSATVINSSVNYFCTAVLGYAIFGEALSTTWWAGASLVLVGVFLIARGTAQLDASATAAADTAPRRQPDASSSPARRRSARLVARS